MRRFSLLMIGMMTLALCLPASAAMVHRYSFDTDTSDSVGTVNGVLQGDAYVQNGSLFLDGVDDWMSMSGPAIAMNTFPAVTIETWYTPVGGTNTGFTMLAYFGGTSGTIGVNYFMMSSAREDNFSRAAITVGDTDAPWGDEAGANGTEYDDNVQHHMAAKIDDTHIYLYIDGQLVNSVPLSDEVLSGVAQTMAALGKGGYSGDPEWHGSFQEFRIYNSAISTLQVFLNNQLGPEKYEQTALLTMSPANNTANVSRDPTDLVWTADPAISVDHFEVYLSTDPNVVEPNSAGQYAAFDTVTAPSLSVNGLTKLKTYYWRVDTIEAGTQTRYVGPMFTFTTAPDNALITGDPISTVAAPDAVLSVSASNAATYQWYKEGTPAVALSDNGIYSGSQTPTLTIAAPTVAEEGYYYCVVSNNLPSEDQSASAYVWTQRLVGKWSFDGNMLDSVTDSYPGAAAHDGVMNSGTDVYLSDANDVGIVGDAIRFTNNGDFVNLGGSEFFNFYPQGMTINYWVRELAPSAWRLPVNKFDRGSRGWLFGLDTNSRNEMVFIVEGIGTWIHGNSAIDLVDGVWHMITITYDPSDKTFRMFTDGDLANSAVVDLTGVALPTAPIYVGGDPTTPDIGNTSIDGAIDELSIYSYSLSETEVADLYVQIRTDEFVCVASDANFQAMDLNNDCRVNLQDFAQIAAGWMNCQRYPAETCLP